MLRRAGKSRRQIKQILGPLSNGTLNEALQGEPPPEWTRRPNAKDDLRARARELRTQGMDYEEIAAALGVAKGSVSLWVRDLPTPARLSYAECRKRSAERRPPLLGLLIPPMWSGRYRGFTVVVLAKCPYQLARHSGVG
jgi:hypothetical protein